MRRHPFNDRGWVYDALVLIAVVLCIMLFVQVRANGGLVSTLGQYHGMTERGYNRGPFIDSANRWARVPLGSPYCASAGGLVVTRLGLIKPPTVPARARAWITAGAIDAKRVWRGLDTVPYPALAIWTRRGGGHFGIAVSEGRHFEFNTSPDTRGSQWDGKWSGWKRRGLSHMAPTNPYRITHFIPLDARALHTITGGSTNTLQPENKPW